MSRAEPGEPGKLEPDMALGSLLALGLGFLICKTKNGGVLVIKALNCDGDSSLSPWGLNKYVGLDEYVHVTWFLLSSW